MKRIIVLFFLIISITSAFPQFYAGGNVGYALPFNSDYVYFYTSSYAIHFQNTRYDIANNDVYYESVPVSFGSGFNANFIFGYMFDNFGIDLEAGYNRSSVTKAYNKTILSSTYAITRYSVWGSYFHFDPSLRVVVSDNSSIRTYAVVGAVVALPQFRLVSVDTSILDNIIVRKWKYTGPVTLGLKTKLGVEYKLSDGFMLFSEIRLVAMSFSPKKGELYEATRNGENRLDDLTTSEKQVVFEKELHNPPSNSAEPTYYLKDSYPFSGLGLNFGLRLEL